MELGFSEIRLYGAENFQVARRLRAMIGTLMQALPERRHPALLRQRELLDQAIDRLYHLCASSCRALVIADAVSACRA